MACKRCGKDRRDGIHAVTFSHAAGVHAYEHMTDADRIAWLESQLAECSLMPPEARLRALIEEWRRAVLVEREEARRCETRERELFEESADTYEVCANELDAALLGDASRPPQEPTEPRRFSE